MAGSDTPSKCHGTALLLPPAFPESAAELKLSLAQCQEKLLCLSGLQNSTGPDMTFFSHTENFCSLSEAETKLQET